MKHLLLTTIAAVLLVGCGAYTSIHEAARVGNVEAVKKHLAAGTYVNAKENDGLTPLHYAALAGHKEIVELLIAAGADVNAKCATGRTPINYAMVLKHLEIAELIRKSGGKSMLTLEAEYKLSNLTVHEAAKERNIELVKLRLDSGVDVNEKNENGWTPLHSAALGGDKEIVKMLIAASADVNAKNRIGWTPLYNAKTKEIVELLIGGGADVNAKDEEGKTPLDWGYLEIADLLRKHGGKTGEELKAEGK